MARYPWNVLLFRILVFIPGWIILPVACLPLLGIYRHACWYRRRSPRTWGWWFCPARAVLLATQILCFRGWLLVRLICRLLVRRHGLGGLWMCNKHRREMGPDWRALGLLYADSNGLRA